jgi:streptogramin lyase
MKTWARMLALLSAMTMTSVLATPISQFPLGIPTCFQPFALALDAHGDAWYGCAGSGVLVRYANLRAPYPTLGVAPKISGTESTTVVTLPSGITFAETMMVDRNGSLWFPTLNDDRIVRYVPETGATAVFPVTPGSRPIALVEGPDGNVWFTTYETGKIGRLQPATGAFVEFAFPHLSHPYRLVAGPDGNLWVGSYSAYIARVTPQGVIAEYPVGGGTGLAFAPDGNLWLAGGSTIVRYEPGSGTSTTFAVPDGTMLRDLALAPDGTLWWAGTTATAPQAGRIGQITLQGDVAAVTMPASAKFIGNIAVRGSDGQIFYSDSEAREIGFISPAFATAPDTTVVEFYNSTLRHYFITANAEEAVGIDHGTAGPGWSRTGQTFGAWLAGPIPQAGRLCRFYGTPGRGPNSHFFTISSAECAIVRQDPGWTLEAAGRFWLVPVGGGCPAFTKKVLRVYNDRFAFNDSNHRYLTDNDLYAQMVALGWAAEGVVFCAPRDAAP